MRKRNVLQTLAMVLPCLCFFALSLGLGLSNRRIATNLLSRTTFGTVAEFTTSLEGRINEDLRQKYPLVNLNGAMNRALGIHTLNEVQKLHSGYLADFPQTGGVDVLLDKLEALSDFFREQDEPFLCVPVPEKDNFYDAQPAPGYEGGQQIAQEFYAQLESRGVPTLNMDQVFREQGMTLEDVYFRTDHHWLPEAALVAAREILSVFQADYDPSLTSDTLAREYWSVDVYEDWMLGSEGRRTGIHYAGVDDLSYIHPNFPTQFQVDRLFSYRVLGRDNRDNVYDLSKLEAVDLFDGDAYGLYGNNYPMAYIRNPLAANDRRLLMVGNSFQLPVSCFLATQFTEIYILDLRTYEEGSFPEFLAQIDPDLTLLLFSGCYDTFVHQYNLESWDAYRGKTPGEPLLQIPSLQLSPARTDGDYRLLLSELAPGSYQLTLDQAALEGTPGGLLQFAVKDLNSGHIPVTRHFFTGYGEAQRWLFTLPEDPSANYALLVFNGVNTQTLGNQASVQGLSLARYS